jgi:hypothetical protein
MGQQQVASYYRALPLKRTQHLRRRATEVLRDGMWAGRPAFILGGGPSLKGFDMSRLEGHLTFGINMAYLLCPTVCLMGSINLMARLRGEQSWRECKSIAIALEAMLWNSNSDYGCRVLNVAPPGVEWGTSFETGFPVANNSGSVALNIVSVLGADPIYLLGFDFHPSEEHGGTVNWHDHYARLRNPTPRRNVYDEYMEDLEGRAAHSSSKIINLNPGSALTCFPKTTIENILTG